MLINLLSKNKQTKTGFTLIELIVAAAIFSVVITVVVAIAVSAIRGQRRTIVSQNIEDNARYLMEFMAKEIRMSEFKTLNGKTTTFSINHSVHGDVVYAFDNSSGIIKRNGEQISSNEVLTEGRFLIRGKNPAGDTFQPRVTIVMKAKGKGAKPEEQAEINLQTTLSQRNLDI